MWHAQVAAERVPPPPERGERAVEQEVVDAKVPEDRREDLDRDRVVNADMLVSGEPARLRADDVEEDVVALVGEPSVRQPQVAPPGVEDLAGV